MPTMKTTKTRTAVSVALTILAAGGFLAGFYYYSNRNISSQAISSCNVDYDRIAYIVEDKVSKFCNANSSTSGNTDNNNNDNSVGKDVDLKASLFSGGSSFSCNDKIAFNVRVSNMGNDPIPSSKSIKVVIEDGLGVGWNKKIAETTINGGLGPKEIKNVEIEMVYNSCICPIHKYCYFQATVDPDNTIAETNEDNNKSNVGLKYRSR